MCDNIFISDWNRFNGRSQLIWANQKWFWHFLFTIKGVFLFNYIYDLISWDEPSIAARALTELGLTISIERFYEPQVMVSCFMGIYVKIATGKITIPR